MGADAAMQRALADDQIACFKKTMNTNPDHSAPGLGFRLSYDTNCQIKS